MPTLLERYVQGEHEQVWAELTALGPGIRDLPEYQDARAVAHETMRRAKANIELLVQRLSEVGYRFGTLSDGVLAECPPYAPPAENTASIIQALTDLAGPIPLSLQAWYEVVGEVYLAGLAPWEPTLALADPLVVESAKVALDDLAQWQEDWDEEGPVEPRLAVIAPDEYHKEDISGGPPYGIALPNGAADAVVENEWHQTTFVAYLRASFVCGGFPGLAREPGGLPAFARELAVGLLPI